MGFQILKIRFCCNFVECDIFNHPNWYCIYFCVLYEPNKADKLIRFDLMVNEHINVKSKINKTNVTIYRLFFNKK